PRFLQRQNRLILPADQYVANAALNESSRGPARPRIEDRYVFVEARNEVPGLGLVVVVLLERIAPSREVSPPRRARSLRVGGNDADARLHQVIPIFDALG